MLVGVGLLGGDLVEQVDHTLRHLLLDRAKRRRVLQQLARDVERQVVGVDEAAHEAKPLRQHRVAILHDKDALHEEANAALATGIVEIEGRLLGHEEQANEVDVALHAEVRARKRRLEVVREMRIELVVLLVGDLAL